MSSDYACFSNNKITVLECRKSSKLWRFVLLATSLICSFFPSRWVFLKSSNDSLAQWFLNFNRSHTKSAAGKHYFCWPVHWFHGTESNVVNRATHLFSRYLSLSEVRCLLTWNSKVLNESYIPQLPTEFLRKATT
jgi:hypothetical protein